MLLRQVVDELAYVKGFKTLYEWQGMFGYATITTFCRYSTKGNLLGRHLDVLIKVAKLLDVPPRFVVRILQLEAIDK